MNIALILGCARSGTSILGELIAAHPEVRYIFEAHRIWELAGAGIHGSHRLCAEHATSSVRTRIREWFHGQQRGASLIVEKTPRNMLRIPFLRAVFPEAKLIHIVRDGRDVACSLMPGIGGAEWRHLKPPSWQTLFSEYSGIVRCAFAWKEIMEIALADLANVPHLQVRYEHLVNYPQEVAQTVVRYLDLPLHQDMVRFCEKIQNTTVGSYHAHFQTRWYRDDHQYRVGRWQENLPAEQKQTIHEIVIPVLRAIDNIPSCSPPGFCAPAGDSRLI